MHDYTVLDSVEKFDTIADTWTVMFFRLPTPLAKLGTVLVD